MNWYKRWKMRRDFKEAASLLRLMAGKIPLSSIKEALPNNDPLEIVNYWLRMADQLEKL